MPCCGRSVLDRQNLLFLGGNDLVNLLHPLVGDLLELFLSLFLAVLCEALILLGFFQGVDAVTACSADSHLGGLPGVLGFFDELAAALLRKSGNDAADDFPVVGRGEADIGVENCLLNLLRSHGWITIVFASGVLMDATWARGVCMP